MPSYSRQPDTPQADLARTAAPRTMPPPQHRDAGSREQHCTGGDCTIAHPAPSRKSNHLQLTQHALVMLRRRRAPPCCRGCARGVRVALRDNDFRARLPPQAWQSRTPNRSPCVEGSASAA